MQLHDKLLKLVQDVAATQLLPRDYADPEARPPAGKVVDFLVDINHLYYQRYIDSTGSDIPARVRLLHTLQFENQFIQDRLSRVERRRVTAPNRRNFLLIQSNPDHVSRTQPPKRDPPRGIARKDQTDLKCFIDPANIVWQQAGLQIPYRSTVAGQPLRLAVNPYPLGKFHTSVIWENRAEQDWKNEEELLQIVRVMFELAMSSRRYIVFYNGRAGASIPNWRHAHLYELVGSECPMPCQHAAACVIEERGKSDTLIIDEQHHPMPLLRFAGPNAAANAVKAVCLWHKDEGDDATENLMVFTEGSETVIYMALRQCELVKATGLTGDLAALEAVGGEFVMSTESEIRAVRENCLPYEHLASALRDVTPWRASEFLGRHFAA